MKQIYTIISIMFAMCIASCEDHLFEYGSDGNGAALVLSAGRGNGYVQTRSVDKPAFQQGTLFHLYGTKALSGSEDWARNYVSKDGTDTKIVKAESVVDMDSAWLLSSVHEKIELDKYAGHELSSVFHTKPLNFYGVTVVGVMADVTPDTPEQITANNAQLDSYHGGNIVDGVPQYTVSYTYAADAPAATAMPDILWSDSLKNKNPYDHSGRLLMPFVHTLSKLNFYAAEADNLDEAYKGKMKILSITIKDYAGGILNMSDGLYKREASAKRETEADMAYFKKDAIITEGPDHFATTVIFPTTDATYTISRYKPEVNDDNAAKVTLVVDVDGTKKTYADLPLTYYTETYESKNECFKPNREYDVTFSLTTNSVVMTLVPKYYDYIYDPEELTDYEMGEPIDFGGVLWAAQNLGATSSDPTESAIAWEEARGFYYQYGRSIPYYVGGSMEDPFPNASIYDRVDELTGELFEYNDTDPSKWWDGENEQWLYANNTVRVPYGNTIYSKAKNHGARAFPYIPYLWERAAANNHNYAYYLKNTRLYSALLNSDGTVKKVVVENGQSAPAKNISDPYYANNASNALNQFAFTCYYDGTSYLANRFWNRDMKIPQNWRTVMNSPAPKGWRLPTKNDYLSIYPSSEEAGDISFCGTHYAGANKTSPSSSPGKHEGMRVYRKYETKKDYNGKPCMYIGIYQDGSGFNDIGNGKFYTIDNKYCYTYNDGWGSVFAVKLMGTDDAYLVRWQIDVADYEEVKAGTVNPARWDMTKDNAWVGRGSVAISKYELDINNNNNNNNNNRKLCIDYRAIPGVVQGTTTNGVKDAQYRCVAFLDENNNQRWDEATEEEVKVNWDNPSGRLYLPIPGYVIVPSYGMGGGQALIYPGSEALYWSADISVDDSGKQIPKAVAVRMKYAGDYLSRFLYISDAEFMANGANVRCVRDTRASYE